MLLIPLGAVAHAADAYAREGLRVSANKAVRNVFRSVVLGGELDGVRGDLMARISDRSSWGADLPNSGARVLH